MCRDSETADFQLPGMCGKCVENAFLSALLIGAFCRHPCGYASEQPTGWRGLAAAASDRVEQHCARCECPGPGAGAYRRHGAPCMRMRRVCPKCFFIALTCLASSSSKVVAANPRGLHGRVYYSPVPPVNDCHSGHGKNVIAYREHGFACVSLCSA